MLISAFSVQNPSNNIQAATRASHSSASIAAGEAGEGESEKQNKNSEEAVKAVNAASNAAKSEHELDQAELKQLRELRARDREVRAHEQAHAAVAGSLAQGGPSYTYQRGPDGALYAVGGEVSIDTSAVAGNAQATAQKAQQVRRAALAPANPSSQDRAVAARAAAVEAQARIEIARENAEEVQQAGSASSIEGDNAEGVDGRAEIDTRVSEESAETSANCAVCGGQHSAQSHTVVERVTETFSLVESDKRAGQIFNIST